MYATLSHTYIHLHSGVFINVNSLPQGAQWLPYISFIKWAFNALAANQFKGMTFACDEHVGSKVRRRKRRPSVSRVGWGPVGIIGMWVWMWMPV